MVREPSCEELQQIAKQMENRCLDRSRPEEKAAWRSLIGNPLIDEVPMGFAYYDQDFVLQGHNRAYADFIRTYTPYTPKQAVGMSFFDYKPGSAPSSEKWLRFVRDSGTGMTRYELPLWMTRDRRESVSYWDAHFAPIKDEAGRITGLMIFCVDRTERKLATEALQKSGNAAANYSQYLEELKRTLRVLLDLKDEDNKVLEENVMCNVRQMVLPFIDRLKQTRLSTEQTAFLSVIESNLRSIIAPNSRLLSQDRYNLTPIEIQIVGLVKEGKISKEIAGLLGVSKACIDFHRNNIRKKLNLSNKKVNLRSYLSSPPQCFAAGDGAKTADREQAGRWPD